MRKKKILLVIPEMSMGGAQHSLSKICLEFSKNHSVWLVIFNKNENISYVHGGELISLNVFPGRSAFSKMKAFTQRVKRLKKLKKKLNIDVSISFLEGADYINILSRTKDKVILSVRGSKRYDETVLGKYFWLRNTILIPWLYRYADLIVTVNHGIAHELRSLYGLKKVRITTIGNFYNIQEIKTLALEPKDKYLDRLYDDPVFVSIGRLAPEKGLKKLMEIYCRLKKQNTRLRFVFVGDGPELPELMEIATRFDLRVHIGSNFEDIPDVVFLGNQTNVFKFLKGATLFLMNSSSEGFPNGLAEALICGIPVVSSDCPYGPREIMAPEFPFSSSVTEPYVLPNGVLMPIIHSEKEIRIWVNTLRDILRADSMLFDFDKNAVERASLFDKQKVMKKWYDLLRK